MTPAIKSVALLCATMLLISVQGSPSPFTAARENALPTESRFLKKLGKSLKNAAKKTGRSLSRAAKKTGRSITRAAKKTGRSITRAAKKTGRSITRAAKKTGRSITRAAKKAGRSITRAAKKTGRSTRRAAKKTGRSITRAAEKTGKFGKKAVKKTGKFIEKAVKKTRKNIQKAVKKPENFIKAVKEPQKIIMKAVMNTVRTVTEDFVCNGGTKEAFGTAFAAAVAIPAKFNCRSMTAAEWAKVGCSSPASHRKTLICAPAEWGGVLGDVIKADAMALKTKILFRNGITRHSLFYTSKGRALMRRELAHIRQQAGVSAYEYGYQYVDAYCDAGRSYSNNRFEKEARKFQNDIC